MGPGSLRRPRVLAVALIVIAAASAAYWYMRGEAAAPTYRFAKVERGPLAATVSASGTLSAVTSVSVGTQVSGQIKELFVDFNSTVKRGQLIARIDPETFEYRVRQAQADADAARSAVYRAQVNLANAQRDLARAKELVGRNFVSPAELDARGAAYELAAAELKAAQATLAQREAQLASARVDLARTQIRAPVDGVVIKRSVDVGQTVAASLQAPELFVIAKDLRDMQVETSIDEADIGRIAVGQRATFTVDAFPGRTFTGEVKQVRKAAQTVQNVVTYTVLVTADNESGQLMPGMTANVRIVTDTRESVLKVPNAALRYRPPGESPAPPTAAGRSAGNGGAPAGAGAQLRERLVGELKLDARQQSRLDPILAEMRAKFMQLRDLPEEARAKAASAIRAEARAKIEDILTPGQKARYAEIAAELGGRAGGQTTRGRIWVLADGRPKPIEVRVGLTDGTATEISGPGVVEGMDVIVGQQGGASAVSAPKGAPPRLFF
ncbi:MAG: efflux RND transporter periplasmic adaptor subunit [Burkholderiaceae bacterium]